MIKPPIPADEEQRLASLRALNLLDTPPEERFDRITRIACRLFDVPIALVNLIDADRQWSKSCHGLNVREIDRDISFCGHAVFSPDPLVVPDTLLGLLDDGHIPVVASIGLGPEGRAYNVNADTVAAELAATLPASRLVLLTDVEGVRDAQGELISVLSSTRAMAMIRDGTVSGGMIPKVVAALRALDGGATVHIIDGRVEHALLLELLTDTGVGTMLRAEPREEEEP